MARKTPAERRAAQAQQDALYARAQALAEVLTREELRVIWRAAETEIASLSHVRYVDDGTEGDKERREDLAATKAIRSLAGEAGNIRHAIDAHQRLAAEVIARHQEAVA